MEEKPSFGHLFKKFRLRAGFATLSEFGKTLSDEGLIFEDSIFSHWQKGNRIPKKRCVLLTLIKIFMDRSGISSLKEAHQLLESTGQGYLTEEELRKITQSLHASLQIPSPKKIIDFVQKVGKSKKILRSGWIREKIKDPESIAEHSFRLSVLAIVLADQLEVDKEKLIKMAILHDLGEVVTGDVVWARGKIIDTKKLAEKEEWEKKGITEVFKIIGKPNEYMKIFEEMTERASIESTIFWQLDKLEMAMQALEYEKDQDVRLDEFFLNADLEIHSSSLREILKEILKQRLKNKKSE